MVDAVHAEQPHGNRAQAVYTPLGIRVPDVDALATAVPSLPLVVRVADCGPVYFYDPVPRRSSPWPTRVERERKAISSRPRSPACARRTIPIRKT